MAKNSKEFKLNIGTASLLLVFIVLCLVTFATLSIVSSNADYKLSKKVAERTTAYYEACNTAQDNLAALDNTLRRLYEQSPDEATYYQMVGKSKSFAVPISDIQTLSVTVTILYPDTAEGAFFEITAWQTLTTGELEYENSMNVMQTN